MKIKKTLRIGTRGSLLAMKQANEVKEELEKKFPEMRAQSSIDIIKIKTSGDINQNQSLSEIGGKGLFSKEIDQALLRSEVDLAVHSLKDLETAIPEGIVLVSVLKREDVRDAMLSNKVSSLASLGRGNVVGTCSPRRKAHLLRLHPHLQCVDLRGNLQTRMQKLENGNCDAMILAMAGLNRLGIASLVKEVIPIETILPAVAQGAIGITCRKGDKKIIELVKMVNDKQTMDCVKCERSMLAALGGTCNTPIGGLAVFNNKNEIWLRGILVKPDGTEAFHASCTGMAVESEKIGYDVGIELYKKAGSNFFE